MNKKLKWVINGEFSKCTHLLIYSFVISCDLCWFSACQWVADKISASCSRKDDAEVKSISQRECVLTKGALPKGQHHPPCSKQTSTFLFNRCGCYARETREGEQWDGVPWRSVLPAPTGWRRWMILVVHLGRLFQTAHRWLHSPLYALLWPDEWPSWLTCEMNREEERSMMKFPVKSVPTELGNFLSFTSRLFSIIEHVFCSDESIPQRC